MSEEAKSQKPESQSPQQPITRLALKLGADPEKISNLSEDAIDGIAADIEMGIVSRHINQETEPIKGFKSAVNDRAYLATKEKVTRQLADLSNLKVNWNDIEDKKAFDPFTLMEGKKVISEDEYKSLIEKNVNDESIVAKINDLNAKVAQKDKQLSEVEKKAQAKVEEILNKYVEKEKDTFLLEQLALKQGEGKIKSDPKILNKFKFAMVDEGVKFDFVDGKVKISKSSDGTDFYIKDENGASVKCNDIDKLIGHLSKVWGFEVEQKKRTEPQKRGILDKSLEVKSGSQAEKFAARRGMEIPN